MNCVVCGGQHCLAAFSEKCGDEIEGLLSGNCALFAIALARLFHGQVCSVQEKGSDGFICHAALLYRGKLYDGGGLTTKDAMRVWCDHPWRAAFFVDPPSDDFLHFAVGATSCDSSYSAIEDAIKNRIPFGLIDTLLR